MIKKYIWDLKTEFRGYNGKALSADIMAGLTVAAVALPLALAFGVSSGADAASGLITAIFAGIFIGFLGGASYQISGPTGAMATILVSLSAQYGMGGVLTAGALAGIVMIIAAVLKAGKLVSFIPQPVITGFTSGIAIIIALGQIDNFFGTHSEGADAIRKLISYTQLGFSPDLWTMIFGIIVVLIMVIYPKKLQSIIPSSLASIIIVLIINMIMFKTPVVKEVGDIPRTLITKNSLLFTGIPVSQINHLILPAISIAILGMIESLLCGASAGKMKHEKLDATRELMAQGIGNIIIPLFGGIPATAAIARTSVAIKAGGRTRLVSVFHSITLILSMFLLGSVMGRIPLSALAGVLMVTAWRMNDWEAIRRIFKNKIKTSIGMFLVTMGATVVFDLTIAIAVGVIFAMVFFVIKSTHLRVSISRVDPNRLIGKGINGNHKNTLVVYMSEPMFFGTQEILTKALYEAGEYDAVIFSMLGVPTIDQSAIIEMEDLVNEFRDSQIRPMFCGVQQHVMDMMIRDGFVEAVGDECFVWDTIEALKYLETNK